MAKLHEPLVGARYSNGYETYHWYGDTESITIEKAQNGWLYSIPD